MQTSIIPLSLALENGRFDAEFYHPKFSHILQRIKSHNYKLLSDLCITQYKNMPQDKHKKVWEYLEIDGVDRFSNSFTTSTLNIGDVIPSRAAKIPAKNDIVVSTVRPTRGAICLLNNIPNNFVVSSGFCIVSPKPEIIPAYLFTILFCPSYLTLYEKLTKASMYPAMSEDDFLSLPIPLFSPAFQKSIEAMVLDAHAQRETANRLSAEAQELLEKELGLFNWQPPKPRINFSVRSYGQTLQAGRIDAEYYQQRYEAIINKLKAYKGGVRALGEISAIQKGIEPGSAYYKDEGIPFVRIANLSTQGLNLENAVKLDASFYKAHNGLQPKKNEVLLSKDGTAGIAYCLLDEPDQMLTSGGILRLKVDSNIMLPEVLALVLNSRSVQAQVEQCAGGAIILHWRMEEVQNTLIPIIRQETQNEIAQKVLQAHAARQKAKGLLQQAKEAVERAIEKGEVNAACKN